MEKKNGTVSVEKYLLFLLLLVVGGISLFSSHSRLAHPQAFHDKTDSLFSSVLSDNRSHTDQHLKNVPHAADAAAAAAQLRGSSISPGMRAPPPAPLPAPPPPPSRSWNGKGMRPEENATPMPVRAAAVVEAIEWAFDGYAKHAWGSDELMPIGKRGATAFCNTGATIIDSMSTLYLAGSMGRFNASVEWALKKDFGGLGSCSMFEINIRIVGGLLSAGALSGDRRLFAKAAEIGDRMLVSFGTASGVPCNSMGSTNCFAAQLAEAGSLSMEMLFLSHVTGDLRYGSAAERAMRAIALSRNHSQCEPGLYPSSLSTTSTPWGAGDCYHTLGTGADSFYEYLLKVYLLTGSGGGAAAGRGAAGAAASGAASGASSSNSNSSSNSASFLPYKRMWDLAMRSAAAKLFACSDNGHLYVTDTRSSHMEHLACFIGGNMALGAPDLYTKDAAAVTESCYAMYSATATGLGADGVVWSGRKPRAECEAAPLTHEDADFRWNSAHSIQRPEVTESLFYLWRTTRNERYRDMAWDVFRSLAPTRVATGGYASVVDVNAKDLQLDDKQQSFFIAEELKYLFMTFSPDEVLDLSKWVLNTEAHPLPVFDPAQPSELGDVCDSAPLVCAPTSSRLATA